MSLTIRTDVTAIKLFNNFIWAGIGCYVHIFDKQTGKLLNRKQCLNGQKIHGLVFSNCNNKVLVYGGKQFTVLTIEDLEKGSVNRIFDPVLCDDWIHCVIWSNEDSILLLTSHNVVQTWNTSNQTMISQLQRADNSILYSGLLLPLQDELIIFTGTVFSEVFIYRFQEEKALHNLKGHRGVIFSICCNLQKEIIVTTSDDRSVRIWTMKDPMNRITSTIDYWKNIEIVCSHEVYGHTARVMRSFTTNNYIISGGEDAAICFWDLNGKLIRKIESHKTFTVWSIDCDDDHVAIGGSDSSITLQPLTVVSDYYDEEVLDIGGTPKRIQFTARNNIVLVTEDQIIYYDVRSKLKMPHPLLHGSTYKMLSLSSCKQIIAVADMTGNINIYIENCKETAYLKMFVETKILVDKLMSLHWAGNRHLVLCTLAGRITVLTLTDNEPDLYSIFIVPNCREKYLTAAAINPVNDMIICGDRCGNIHCYVKGQEYPVKTFKRNSVDTGLYGPTSITIKDNLMITTGRTGTYTFYSLNEDIEKSKYLSETDLGMQWVEKFLDKNQTLVCGFMEKNFVIYCAKTNTRLLEVNCGGGHRPWDAIRYFDRKDNEFEEFVRMVYCKNSQLYMVTSQLSKIVSKTIVKGSQTKNIHCLKTYKSELDRSITFYITGGEDTTLRVSSMNTDFEFEDETSYRHISNIKTFKTYAINDNELLVISAGGRAQMCFYLIKFKKVEEKMKVSCEKLYSHCTSGFDFEVTKTGRHLETDFNPDTRMIALDAIRLHGNQFIIIVGCSDVYFRVYSFDYHLRQVEFRCLFEPFDVALCIFKTVYIKFNDKLLVVFASSRGNIVFWEITLRIKAVDQMDIDMTAVTNILHANNSGTNSLDYKILGDKLMLAAGGDDNSISLYLLSFSKEEIEGIQPKKQITAVNIIDNKKFTQFHCSQISGLAMLDGFLISASIDQRVTVCKWRVADDKIECEFLRQVHSDIADVKGLEILEHSSESVTACVFGAGLEVLKLDLTDAMEIN